MEKLWLFFVLQFPTDNIGWCPSSLSSQHMRFLAFSAERYVLYMTDMIVVMRYTSIDIPVKCESERSFLLFLVSGFHEYRCDLEVTVFWTHAQDFTASYPLPCSQNNQTENVICLRWYYSSTKLWCRVFGIQFCALRSLAQSAAAAGDWEKGARPSVQFKFWYRNTHIWARVDPCGV